MTIAETLLQKLNEWEAAGTGRQHWAQPVGESGWALNLVADRVDSLGCLLWEATLTRADSAPTPNSELKSRAVAAAERITGLMESISFLELDELRGLALLRSETPSKRTGSLGYYEVLMSGNRIEVRRYQRSADKDRRDQIAFALTHEAIAKLVDDLIRE